MKICGLMKTTLLDFPGHVACTVFLGGCNMRCPFCHNSALAFLENGEDVTVNDFFDFLKKRKNVLEGVCITGGEPLLNDDIIDFVKRIKDLGFKIKLDTNGSFPDRLDRVLATKMIDYVAMDIKNSVDEYKKTTGLEDLNIENILKSIEIIKNCGIDHEFRTTVSKGLHTKESIRETAKMIEGEEKYFIQNFKMSEGVPDKSLDEFTKEELGELLSEVQKYVPGASLRGI